MRPDETDCDTIRSTTVASSFRLRMQQMPVEQNPYESIPLEPVTSDVGRRRLTISEAIGAFLVTLIVSGVTLFATCIGVLAIGPRSYSESVPGTVFVLFLWIGVPILISLFVGRLAMKSFILSVTATPTNNSGDQQAPHAGAETIANPAIQSEDSRPST